MADREARNDGWWLTELPGIEVEAIREALANATPGPWERAKDKRPIRHECAVCGRSHNSSDYETITTNRIDGPQPDSGWPKEVCAPIEAADAHLIAHAPTWLSALLSALEEAQRELAKYRAKYRANPLWNVRVVEHPDFSMEGDDG